ncbi:MAG TPA: CPBP family intramembrane glutamic endopeptidase [Blastocatellia bacterium]|nr:CPBP family intramembrane glutamic endopeptidase [Blastocatellia bacterium]
MSDRAQSGLGWPTALGLLVALGGPEVVAAISLYVGRDEPNIGLQVFLQVLFCGLGVFIVLLVRRGEHLPLSSIGLKRPGWSTAVTALLLFLAGFWLLPIVTNPMVKAWGREGADAGIAQLAVLPAWFRVILGATGGIVEETLYRGYAVERLTMLTGRRWLGAGLATLAFAAAHIPAWGIGFALTADLPAGILLVAFYLWRRDLIANMLAHSAGLIVAMFTIVPRAV